MSKRGSKRVGIKDIALQAGVSIGTVDRVLHNRGDVKDETRRRVMGIVDKLGYSPNLIAKTLSSKKLTRISIVIPESSDSNPYWGKPIIGIKLAIEELTSFNTEIEYKTFDLSDEQSYINALQNVYNENPDGVVLNPVFKSASNNFIKLFDERNIPYVFIDINLKDANNLAYFGLNAMESGRVAARLMDLSSPKSPTYLLVKQANKKVFSHHIENRIKGFCKYFEEQTATKNAKIIVVEIDLLDPEEPTKSLSSVFNNTSNIDGIFVPNSRSYKLADYLVSNNLSKYITIGYDLIEENVEHLKKGNITYLISQRPEEQAYKAILALFNKLQLKKQVVKINYSSIDIIVKENIDYYIETK